MQVAGSARGPGGSARDDDDHHHDDDDDDDHDDHDDHDRDRDNDHCGDASARDTHVQLNVFVPNQPRPRSGSQYAQARTHFPARKASRRPNGEEA
jgi:hypothetical protein